MLVLLAITVVVVLLLTSVYVTSDYVTFRRTTITELATLARVLAGNTAAALAFRSRRDAEGVLATLKADDQIVAGVLYDATGRPFATYPRRLNPAQFPPRPGPDGFRFDGTNIDGFQPVIQGTRLGVLYLETDMARTLRSWLWAALGRAGAVIIVVLCIAYLLARMLQQQISRPILALAGAAGQVRDRQDFSVRVPIRSRDEVAVLTHAFNAMLAEVQRQDQQRRRAEAEVRELNQVLEKRVAMRTAQLEAVNKELEAFSYSVSHDLRAPLRHIDGFTQLLDRRIGATLGDTDRRYLTTISSAAKGLGTLIDELLAFSRMSRAEMQRVQVDMAAVVAEVAREFEPEVGNRRVDWRVAPLPTVEGDVAMLRQVWRNLIGNAVKYTRKCEVATITIEHRQTAGEGHVFAVRDNGAGFEIKYAAKLFGVFQRLHTAAEFEGTGIGLANVRRIVQRHGGRTWAEGAVGEGAAFYFTLPTADLAPLAATTFPI